ncbi:MAG: hypothetical protein DBX47_00880 [Clostridiales bacterium]|nr:MAG: hypothetical protein DBX47_00880 [Clostridiales bacterium]
MDKKMFKSILLLAILSILVVACLIRIDLVLTTVSFVVGLFTPLFIGMGIALVLSRPYKSVRRSFAKIIKKDETSGLVKAVSIMLVYLFTLAVIALLLLFILPEIMKSITEIINKYPVYLEGFKGFLANLEIRFGIQMSLFDKLVEALASWFDKLAASGTEGLVQTLLDAFPQIFSITKSIAGTVTNTLIGFAMSIYLLASREFLIRNIKRVTYAFMPSKAATRACEITSLTTDTFTKYISGQLLDAVIVGTICFIGLSIFGFPYAGLISLIVATTNIIPFFGPFLGAIPSAILLLAIDPKWAFFFVIFIVIVQQVDGNIIVPRIIGDRTGIPSLLVMLSIIIAGGIFGIIGMLIGVPTAAVIYKVVKRYTTQNLRDKDLDNACFDPYDNNHYEQLPKPESKLKKFFTRRK